jgi:transposase
MDKKRRNAKQFFSDSFKRQLIEEHLATGQSKLSLQAKHGIHKHDAIMSWMYSLGYLQPKRKNGNLAPTNPGRLPRKAKKQPQPGDAQAEIARLKRELEDERLRSQMYLRMIDIAEKDYNIPIRKKPGTK